MSKNHFTDEQVQKLKCNENVLNVSHKAITYTNEFKAIFIQEYTNGKSPTQIFIDHDFDIDALGAKRISTASSRWRKQSQRYDGLVDNRKNNQGRPLCRTLTQEEQLKKYEDRIKYLEAENEFLKKLEQKEMEAIWKAKSQKKRNLK